MKFLLSLSLKVKIIIAACTVAAAAAVTGAVIVLNSEEAYRVIKVFELEGSAAVEREAGKLNAYVGMNLESGDVLSVDDNSLVRISLDGDKYILLDSGTVMELYAEGSASDSRTTINLKEGTILNEITNALSANSSYEVNTPKATMAVRGTSFSVTVEKQPSDGYLTDIDTIHGTVAVRLFDEYGNPKGSEVFVTAGYRATISTDRNSITGNSPEIDGKAYFVFRDKDGIVGCDGHDPVYPSDYSNFSYAVKEVALGSNDSGILVLDKEIADKLRGGGEAETVTESKTNTETQSVHSVQKEQSEISSVAATERSMPPEKTAETTVPIYTDISAANVTFLDVPTVTTAPPEIDEPKPVIPSEITSARETEPPIRDTAEAAAETHKRNTKKNEAEPSAETERRNKSTAAPIWQNTARPPAQTAPYTTPAASIGTTVTTVPEVTTTKPESETTTVPEVTTTEPEPETTMVPEATTTEPEPETTTVPEVTTTEPESETTTVPEITTTEPESETTTVPEVTTTEPESETTTEPESTTTESETTTKPLPVVHNVSFVDENGTVLSATEVEDGGNVGTLPEITDKRGYTGKWVSGGPEVTADTAVTSDMEITAEYTPKTVTVRINAPHGTPDDTYGTVKEITVLYDGAFSSNAEGETIESITAFLTEKYGDYVGWGGTHFRLKSVTIMSKTGDVYAYDDPADDNTVITGDRVLENEDGTLYAEVTFIYESYIPA